MDSSPISDVLAAMDRRDLEATLALFTDDAHLLTVDGRSGDGIDAVRGLLSEFLENLRSASHHITDQWHEDNVWIAEVEATYELADYLQLSALPRAFIARERDGKVADLRAYGAHERALADHPGREAGMWIGERWIPPL